MDEGLKIKENTMNIMHILQMYGSKPEEFIPF